MAENVSIAQVAWEHRERAEREGREWYTARLHNSLHGNWLAPDECDFCLAENADDDEPIDMNREGDPNFNGAW